MAAGNGHLHVLQWARQQGCHWDGWTCALAARHERWETLRWAREQGCPWDERTCVQAARGGHLHILQWVRKEGCPWDEETCAAAARNGHLDLLQWLRETGCPWDEHTCIEAARKGYVHVVAWALQQDPVLKPRCLSEPCPVWNFYHDDLCPWCYASWFYRDRQWLRQHRAVQWHPIIVAWLDTLQNVATLQLSSILLPELTSLVLQYC